MGSAKSQDACAKVILGQVGSVVQMAMNIGTAGIASGVACPIRMPIKGLIVKDSFVQLHKIFMDS